MLLRTALERNFNKLNRYKDSGIIYSKFENIKKILWLKNIASIYWLLYKKF